mmetsp:Transcript_25332/g.58688  ORF Transcript_25332/g.58688 Transcript_25332/m.58688 type:complete len:174 (+) Transcript_25332:79-600(+)
MQSDTKLVLAQTTVVGAVLAGGACSVLCHILGAMASWAGVKNPKLLLEALPLLGFGGCLFVGMKQRNLLKEIVRELSRGTRDEEERLLLQDHVFYSTSLQTMAAGGGGSLFVHFLTLVAADRVYGLMYSVSLFGLGFAWLAVSLIMRARAAEETVRPLREQGERRERGRKKNE